MGMKKKKSRFLVTGAAGFVGTHMVKMLADKGHSVVACDLKGTDGGKFEALGVKFVPVDITNKQSLMGVMENIDYVMHIAAIFDYSASWRDLWRVNVKGTRNVCEAAAEQGVAKLVYFSSCDIYGSLTRIPADEHSKIRPNHNYGESKFLGEREAFKVSMSSKLKVTVLRPTALYGPGSTYGAILLVNLMYKGLMPGIPGDGKVKVHLVHLKDVINAGLFLAEHTQSAGQEFNISDNTPVELEDLLKLASEGLGFRLPRIHIPRVMAEMSVPFVEAFARLTNTRPLFNKDMMPIFYSDHVFDSSKIKKLGYKLKYPDVRTGFQDVLQWYKEKDVLKQNISSHRVRLKEIFQ
jgi:dihydroflavonol-4-reductase